MKVTRGYGLLEKFLSNQRSKIVDKNIGESLRSGKILDIGCGNFPYFLSKINFKEKIGLDKEFGVDCPDDIELINFNFENEKRLPFADESFEVVSILAVLEHIKEDSAMEVLREVRRILKKNGELFITVPRDKGDKLLKILSNIGLVSKVEIDEHVQLYNPRNITYQLLSVGFKKSNIKVKSFELGLNIFVKVKK